LYPVTLLESIGLIKSYYPRSKVILAKEQHAR